MLTRHGKRVHEYICDDASENQGISFYICYYIFVFATISVELSFFGLTLCVLCILSADNNSEPDPKNRRNHQKF